MNTPAQDDSTAPGFRPFLVPGDDVDVFLRSWTGVAALLIDRHLTLSGSSPLAAALFPRLHIGMNLVREVFLGSIPGREPECARTMSGQIVSALHSSLASHHDDAEFRQIVGELSALSQDFSAAWAGERVALRSNGVMISSHPVAGDLLLRYQVLELAAASNELLVIWQAADARSESALADLALAS